MYKDEVDLLKRLWEMKLIMEAHAPIANSFQPQELAHTHKEKLTSTYKHTPIKYSN